MVNQITISINWHNEHIIGQKYSEVLREGDIGYKSLDVWINGFLCSFAILINCTNPFVFKTIWKMLNRIFWVTNRNCQTNNKITREAIITLEQYTFRRVLTIFLVVCCSIYEDSYFKYTINAITLPRIWYAMINIEYNMQKETLFPWVIKFTRS